MKKSVMTRVLSFILILAMILTMGAFTDIGQVVTKAEGGTGIKLYFRMPEQTKEEDWAVNCWGNKVKVEQGNSETAFRPSTWGDGEKYPTLLKSDQEGWGYVVISGTLEGLQFVNQAGGEYKCWDNEIYNKGWTSAYFDPASNCWYADAQRTQFLRTPAPEFNSPVVDGQSVTFRYYSEDAEKVVLAGSMNGWNKDNTDYQLTKGENNIWSITCTLTPGAYEYKFVINGADWQKDSKNTKLSGDNSVVYVAGLVAGDAISLEKGKTESLPKSLTCYTSGGQMSSASVNYRVKSEEQASYVTIDNDEKTIHVSEEYTGKNLELIAFDENGNTAELAIQLVDQTYVYHIYYYSSEESRISTDATALWLWKDGSEGAEYKFDSVETIATDVEGTITNATWLQATLKLPVYGKMNVIPKSLGAWNWQDTTVTFTSNSTDETVIYIVSGSKQAYTQLPEIGEKKTKNVVLEYTRTNKDYDGWNVYSWNTGLSNGTELYGQVTDGVSYISIPVADTTVDVNLGFCMRKTTAENAWEEKDGGDHYIKIPANQQVVKAKFVEGKGITEVLPYNIGYEMDGENDTIHFYYRDDEAYKQNAEDTLAAVALFVNGTKYDMSYDAANERYVYNYTEAETGMYSYCYEVKDEEGNITTVLDAYNAQTVTENDKTYSVVSFKKAGDFSIQATPYYDTMDADDNNVIAISFVGENKLDSTEVASASMDLSALGLGTLAVRPELMAATIACKTGTALGKKNIPVTVKDIYGNIYKTSATVTVVADKKTAKDFDWDEAVVYFTVTDRFFDGNKANDADIDTTKESGTLSYHGGDFAGLEEKLDELKALGVNTIWITPIVENSDTTTKKDGKEIASTGYHGYWTSDFTKLNEHLGTEEEFAALISAVHNKGMKLMVDVVLNHAGYGTESYFNSILVNEETDEKIAMLRDDTNSVEGSDIYASLAGLPDFVTENAAVRNQLIEWQTSWMTKYDIDYYRVDTVKHVDSTTWAAFKNALTEKNQDFKLIGEYAGAGSTSKTGELGTGSMDALLDFDFAEYAKNFVTADMEAVENALVTRNQTINNTATMGSFLNNHDKDGLCEKLMKESNLSKEEAENLLKVASSLMITAKGIPVIYYGEEIGLHGEDNYPYQTNRYDYDWQMLETQKTEDTSIYNHYKKMLAIRNSYTDVFARGNRQSILVSKNNGIDVFSRSYQDDKLYVALNVTSAEVQQSIAVTEVNGAVLEDLYSGNKYTVTEGKVEVVIPSAIDGGTVVLVETEDKEPQNKEPSVQEPSVQEPSVQEPSVQEPQTQEPSIQEPSVQEPGVQEPSVQEPQSQEPQTQEPQTQEPSVQEPQSQEPQSQEPQSQEPQTQEPSIQESQNQEPSTQVSEVQQPVTQPSQETTDTQENPEDQPTEENSEKKETEKKETTKKKTKMKTKKKTAKKKKTTKKNTKKTAAKKTTKKTAANKKTETSKKTATKKTTSKQTATKKATSKKTATKKTTSKQTGTKKVTSKKTTKKNASKNTTTKKSTSKKSTKKTAPKQTK